MSPTLKSTGEWVTMCPNLGVFPLEQTRHVLIAKSEHPRLTKGEITFENSNLCDHNPPTSQTDRETDRRTDRQTTCDRNTALCTKVHRAVKTVSYDYEIFTIRYPHLSSCCGVISRVSEAITAKRMKIDSYCQRRNCSPHVLFSDV